MNTDNRWLLPEGIEEVLPPQALQLDAMCRRLIDLYTSWGYQLVLPPLIEYLESLLTGTGEDLDLQTFKITDQLTGRMMGIRADTTPQMARIDVHNLKRDYPTRLCYMGTVLHTRPSTHGGTRAPLQTGAELYGNEARESDAEILALMLKTLHSAGINNIHVDLGHVGIYRCIREQLQLSREREPLLFDILQKKAVPELQQVIADWKMPVKQADMLRALIELNGDASVLEQARTLLRDGGDEVLRCIDELERIAHLTRRQVRDAPLFFDLAELRGYRYYTGMAFASYVPGLGQGVAFGGRYDDIGKAFGRARPATGFSTDVMLLFNLAEAVDSGRKGIYAPCSEVPSLMETIDRLRAEGEIVICALPGQNGGAREMACDRELVIEGGQWKVKKV